MQVFKTYFKILKKRIVAIMIYAGIFLFLTAMMTMNSKIDNQQYETSKVEVMVVNNDGESPLIDGFMKYLGNYAVFIEPTADEDARKDALFYQEVKYILTIPEGFSEDFLADGSITLSKQTVPDSVESMSIDTTINNYFNMARVYIKNVPNISFEKLNSYITANLQNETQVKFDVTVQDDTTYSNSFNTFYYNFLGYTIIGAFITGVSMIMFSFNGMDIRRRHTASPITNRKFNICLILANFVFVIAYMIIFIVAGYVFNKGRMINMNTILTWLNALVFAFTALSMSYLVGISVNSRKSIGAISTALSLSLSFMSGIFVPQQYLGSTVLRVASFTPSYWYVKVNDSLKNMTSFGWNDTSQIFGYMGIQIGFAFAILCIALVVSKRKRQQAF